VIFKTKWGYFGLTATEKGLLKTCLPLSNPEKVKLQILKASFAGRELSIKNRASSIEFDKDLFKMVQEQITAYFEGVCVNFDKDIPIVLACPERGRGNGFSFFAGRVLNVCRQIKFGQTISYAGLAKKIGQPAAYRAVGGALAKNPLPLIIPCHRVVRSDGKIGGFSAGGGKNLKEKLLKHERRVLIDGKND